MVQPMPRVGTHLVHAPSGLLGDAGIRNIISINLKMAPIPQHLVCQDIF